MSAAVEPLPFARFAKDMDRSRKPRACRNLFGRPDKDEIDNLLHAELQRYKNEDCNKYNFDFDSDTPLDGKYEWDRCDSQDIPEFYRPVTVVNGKRFPQRTPRLASEASGCRPVQSATQTTTSDISALPLGLQARLHGLTNNQESSTDESPKETQSARSSASCAKTKSTRRPTKCPSSSSSRRQTAASAAAANANQPKITGRCTAFWNFQLSNWYKGF